VCAIVLLPSLARTDAAAIIQTMQGIGGQNIRKKFLSPF